MHDHDALALALVGDRRNGDHGDIGVFRAEQAGDRALDQQMRDRLSANLGELRLSAGDGEKALVVQLADVTRVVPAIDDHAGRERGVIEVPEHDIWAFGPDDPFVTRR
jgi:hypothetical protein